MAPEQGTHQLKDSERRPAAGVRRLGPAAADETLTVTVRVRRPPGAPALPDHGYWEATPPGKRQFLSHDEYARLHSAAKGDLDAVARFARRHGLRVAEVHAAGRTVSLHGTVAQMNQAFGVDLGRYEVDGGDTYRGRDGFVHVPGELAEVVVAVFGLDNRRIGFRNGGGDPPVVGPLLPTDVAQIYNFPAGAHAAGQTIGVIEFGGGYDVSDLKLFFSNLGAGHPTPIPVDVSIGGSNGGSGAFGADEVTGDICTAGGVAPQATIQVYFGPEAPSGNDWHTVLNLVAHPPSGEPPAVVSISWTLIGADDQIAAGTVVSAALVNEISGIFQEMAALGVTILVASGDGGSNGWNNPAKADGKAHVGYPASDPWVTSCGGTTLGFAAAPSTAVEEWVWNEPTADGSQEATGGGVSAYFPLPSWQQGVAVPASLSFPGQGGRGVPDVAGNSGLASNYSIWVDTVMTPFSGTSAVAPLYAGLAALLNQQVGERIGFLNPTLYAFRDSVCRDVNAQLFAASPQDNGLHGGGGPQDAPGYPSGPGWDACTGLGSIDGGALLAALGGVFRKECHWVVDRTSIGESEVQLQVPSVATPALIPNAFYVVVDGVAPADLGITTASLSGTPDVAPVFTAISNQTGTAVAGMSVVATALLAEDDATDANGSLLPTPQRFTWVCAASFTNTFGFIPAPVVVTLGATLPGPGLSATGIVQLKLASDPYEMDGAIGWLSTDLRVFQMETGNTLAGLDAVTKLGNTGGVEDPIGFIQDVLKAFNSNPPPPNHPFDLISTDEQVSEVTLDAIGANGLPVYNFAVARVRYQSAVESGLVRVFFRLFQAASTATTYFDGTYGSFSSGGKNGFKIPVFGVDGAGNLVTIPCFAEARVSPGTPLSSQTDTTNVMASIAPDSAGGVTYAYFGCWLDINQQPWQTVAVPITPPPLAADAVGPWSANELQTVMASVRGTHQCLVAEVSYDDDPMLFGETAGSSDKLAQRNLMIVSSDNPGDAASHQIPHTFDLQPTPAGLVEGSTPDELMIEWGNTPAGSTARLYLPGVDAAEVLEMATKMYPRHLLTRVDNHTLQCRVAGATYVPLPRGVGNFAGLFTLDLPATVRRGQVFTVVTRQITSAAYARKAVLAPAPSGRYVLGAYQLTIPVSTKALLLAPEERDLAALRYIAAAMAPGDRWAAVFTRYLEQVAARVKALGGDPGKIQPSPAGGARGSGAGSGSGAGHGPRQGHPPPFGGGQVPGEQSGKRSYTGKVGALIYDGFGDFAGFRLDTEDGEQTFDSREPAVEEVVGRAWEERIRTTVVARRHRHRQERSLVSIVLHGA